MWMGQYKIIIWNIKAKHMELIYFTKEEYLFAYGIAEWKSCERLWHITTARKKTTYAKILTLEKLFENDVT